MLIALLLCVMSQGVSSATPGKIIISAPDGYEVEYRSPTRWEKVGRELVTPPLLGPVEYRIRFRKGGEVVNEQLVVVRPGETKEVNWSAQFGVLPYTPEPPKLSGQPVSKEEALQALRNQLPNYAGKLHVTVIGPAREREPVVKMLSGFDSIILRDYDPDAWQVADVGFVTKPGVQIYCQSPDGTVLWRTTDPHEAVKALRKPGNYDPAKDKKPGGDIMSFDKLDWLSIVIGILAGWFLFRKNEK